MTDKEETWECRSCKKQSSTFNFCPFCYHTVCDNCMIEEDYVIMCPSCKEILDREHEKEFPCEYVHGPLDGNIIKQKGYDDYHIYTEDGKPYVYRLSAYIGDEDNPVKIQYNLLAGTQRIN
jgi:hypothetical protein